MPLSHFDHHYFSCVETHRWFVYDTVEGIDALIASLAAQGIRESALVVAVKEQYKDIVLNIKKYVMMLSSDNYTIQNIVKKFSSFTK